MPLVARVGTFQGDNASASEQELSDAFVKIMPSPSRVRTSPLTLSAAGMCNCLYLSIAMYTTACCSNWQGPNLHTELYGLEHTLHEYTAEVSRHISVQALELCIMTGERIKSALPFLAPLEDLCTATASIVRIPGTLHRSCSHVRRYSVLSQLQL